MRVTILFILAALSQVAAAQMPPDFTYKEVVELDSVSKEQLYDRAKIWLVSNFRDANSSSQIDNKELGNLSGKGVFNIYLTMNTRYVRYNISFDFKDGRYRYIINQFILDWGNGVATVPFEDVQSIYHNRLFTQSHENVLTAIASLKKAMSTANQDDW